MGLSKAMGSNHFPTFEPRFLFPVAYDMLRSPYRRVLPTFSTYRSLEAADQAKVGWPLSELGFLREEEEEWRVYSPTGAPLGTAPDRITAAEGLWKLFLAQRGVSWDPDCDR